ncbi:MAG: hypothetical protein ACYDDF_05330 [Thermoplasmatota archaeon]
MAQHAFTCKQCGTTAMMSNSSPNYSSAGRRQGGPCPKDNRGDHYWVAD